MQLRSFQKHEEVYNKVVPLEQIERLLSSFRLQDTLLRLQQLNILLSKAELENKFDYIQNFLRANFFNEETYNRIEQRYNGKLSHVPVFFTRIQLLTLMRLCTRVCSREATARSIDKESDKFDFGNCCLWITDHLETETDKLSISEGTDDDRRRALGPQMAATVELSDPPDLIRAIVRADIFYGEIIHNSTVRKKIGKSFDFQKAFAEATGVTIEQFRDFIFLIVTWFQVHTIEEITEDTSKFVFNKHTFLKNTSVDETVFNKLLKLTAIPISDLPDKLNAHRGGAPNRDFTFFRSYPLLELENGTVACLDLDYLVEKLSTGVYWALIDNPKYKNDAQRAIGYIFEEYVNDFFRLFYPRRGRDTLTSPFTEEVMYQGKAAEAFDGLIQSPTNTVQFYVMQYKSQFIPPKIKYNNDGVQFEHELDQNGKFGKGEKCGVTQLIENIEQVWHQNAAQRTKLRIGEFLTTEKITPILVVQEDFFRFDFFNWTLNNRMQELLKKAHIMPSSAVESLLVIDIYSLEIIKPHILAGHCTLQQAINSLLATDPTRLHSFYMHLQDYLRQFPHVDDPETTKRFHKIVASVRALFNVVD